MNAAAAALSRLCAAGVRVLLRDDGTVALDAAAPPAPTLLADARAHRDGIATLLRELEGRAPAPGTTLPSIRPALLDMKSDAWAGKRPPSWADPGAIPQPGAWCGCCLGRRWWCEVRVPLGWRCWTCHPSVHLAQGDVREVLR